MMVAECSPTIILIAVELTDVMDSNEMLFISIALE
jgi:hypothetical protein